MTVPSHPPIRSMASFAQRLSATPLGARLARHLAGAQLEAWGFPFGTDVSDRVLLIVAELATNAAIHGSAQDIGDDFELRLSWNRDSGVIRVEVSDGRSGPLRKAASACAESGRGLVIVDSVAGRWGVSPGTSASGKTVFAEVPSRQGDRSAGCQ